MSALKNLNILITRPEPLAAPLAKSLAAEGAKTTIFSVLQIKPVDEANNIAIPRSDIIIFISPNAVFNSVALNPSAWQLQNSDIISMGSGTTQALAEYNIKVTAEPVAGATSENLVNLPELSDIKGKNILIVAGEGGRDLISQTLTERGANCQKLVVYKRSKPNTEMPTWVETFDVMIVTSGESLSNLEQFIHESGQPELLSVPLLIISQRMVNLVKQSGFTGPVLVSQGASDAAIIKRLKKWMQTHE